MDEKGYWHHVESEKDKAGLAEAARLGSKARKALEVGEINDELRSIFPGRKVIEIGIGESVNVVKDDGEKMRCTFDAAEKNRVTLTAVGLAQRPYFELAEHVQIQRDSGESIRAQVWDNRNGKLILRTLPQ